MNENSIDDSDAFIIVGIVLCSFDHWGGGFALILLGCICGILGALVRVTK